jgi:energy-coupling factor transporter ATP-binding protein EcfA2
MTAIAKIVDWINEPARPIWWRHAIRLLIEKQSLTAEDHTLLCKIARKEAGFGDIVELIEDYAAPVSSEGFKLEEKPVTLISLGPTLNISALASDQILKFSKTGLTVVYGDNGSGKSSLSKILKNVCLTRGEKPAVIGNAFQLQPSRLSAKISYQVNDEAVSDVDWEYKGDEISALKSIRVFDSKSAFHYLEKEGVLDYRPAGLHLLDELVSANNLIRTFADEKIKTYGAPLPLPTFDKSTTSGNFASSISVATTLLQLEAQCVTAQELLDLETINSDLLTLKTKTAVEIRKTLSTSLKSITPLIDALKATQSINSKKLFDEYILLIKNKKTTSEAAELARTYAFSDLPIDNVGSEVWKSLWSAAELFFITGDNPAPFPPKTNDNCPLCLQTITETSSVRLERFETYTKDKTQTNADSAKKALSDKRLIISSTTFDLTPYDALIAELDKKILNFSTNIKTLKSAFDIRKNTLLSDDLQKIEKESIEFIPIALNDLIKYNEEINKELTAIVNDNAIEAIYLEKQKSAREINSKKTVKDNKATLELEIKRQKQLDAYTKIRNQTNPRSITSLSSSISETYLTTSLKEHFNAELKQLGFSNYVVSANTRNSNGAQLFKIALADSKLINVHEIASEGEQKCFALASVLAELKADNRRSGVIFDDPVNSLDHKWRQKIARRLIQESTQRQVIIFTHEIIFLKLLLEEAELTDNPNIQISSLDRSLKNSGIVRNSLPWDALPTSKRITQLEVMLRQLKKTELVSEIEYNNSAGSFYGYLREAWERLVEEKLLNKVVERFGRAIQTNRLKRLQDICDNDIEIIENAMSKCSTLFKGHDTAPGLYETMPNTDEIESDIKIIRDFENELTKTRKRS